MTASAWGKDPDDPIIRRGQPGQGDDGAIWVAELIKHRHTWYARYEGRGARRDRNEEYSRGATKQIGLLTNTGPLWPGS